MPDAASVLLQRLQAAYDTIAPGADPVFRPSDRADFQANGALPLAKVVGRPPRQIADEVVAAASLDDICAEVEVSGPGFINLTLSDGFVAGPGGRAVRRRAARGRGGPTPRRSSSTIPRPTWPRRCTSATSAARSSAMRWHGSWGSWVTTCGARTTSATGARPSACSSNTCSTWMARSSAESFSVRDLNEFYAAARARSSTATRFAERCRHRVVLLQSGRRRDAAPLADLRRRVHASRGRGLRPARGAPHRRGRPGGELLQPVAAGRRLGAGRAGPAGGERRGALRVPRGLREPQRGTAPADRAESPTAATATRRRTWPPCATEPAGSAPPGSSTLSAPSSPYTSRLVFAVSTLAGYLRAGDEAIHVGFGLVLGADGKQLASRAGGPSRLIDLLTEGIDRAAGRHEGRSSDLTPERQAAVAHALGVGAVKYADLSTERARGTSSTGTGCWPSRATPAPTCSTRTHGCGPFSGAPAWPRRHRVRCRSSASPRTCPGVAAPGFCRGGRGDGGDLQPVQALHLPLRPGHFVHGVLRGLPGPGRRRGGAGLRGSGCAT